MRDKKGDKTAISVLNGSIEPMESWLMKSQLNLVRGENWESNIFGLYNFSSNVSNLIITFAWVQALRH